MTPFVSIILPVKNEKFFIERCLGALQAIEYPRERYEIIVVDNGSTDATVAIAESHGASVYIQPDLTIAGLRNYGADVARGDVVAFLDADVVVAPEWLRNGVAVLQEVGVGCAGCSPDIPVNSTWVERIWSLHGCSRPDKCDREWIASMNLLVWKRCFDEINGFNVNLRTCEDVDFGYRFTKNYRIVSDKKIKAVHFGEAKTLLQLFKKESWRGISNFHGIQSHGIILKEMPSHILATYYFLLLTCFPLMALKGLYVACAMVALPAIAFPLCRSLGISIRLRQTRYLAGSFVIWMVYGFARGWSVWRAMAAHHERT